MDNNMIALVLGVAALAILIISEVRLRMRKKQIRQEMIDRYEREE